MYEGELRLPSYLILFFFFGLFREVSPMSTKCVPHLGLKHWVTDPVSMLDLMLAQSMVSEWSQTNQYRGTITSFPYLVAKFGSDPLQMTRETETAYQNYIEKHYEGALVTVTFNDPKDGSGKYELYIYIEVFVDGKKYDLTRGFSIIDSTFKKISEISNNGRTTTKQ